MSWGVPQISNLIGMANLSNNLAKKPRDFQTKWTAVPVCRCGHHRSAHKIKPNRDDANYSGTLEASPCNHRFLWWKCKCQRYIAAREPVPG